MGTALGIGRGALPSYGPRQGCQSGKGNEQKGVVTPTETNVHGDALCLVVKTWARHKTTEGVLSNGWRLAAVGGWWQLVIGGWRRLAVGGSKGLSFTKKKKEFLSTALDPGWKRATRTMCQTGRRLTHAPPGDGGGHGRGEGIGGGDEGREEGDDLLPE